MIEYVLDDELHSWQLFTLHVGVFNLHIPDESTLYPDTQLIHFGAIIN